MLWWITDAPSPCLSGTPRHPPLHGRVLEEGGRHPCCPCLPCVPGQRKVAPQVAPPLEPAWNSGFAGRAAVLRTVRIASHDDGQTFARCFEDTCLGCAVCPDEADYGRYDWSQPGINAGHQRRCHTLFVFDFGDDQSHGPLLRGTTIIHSDKTCAQGSGSHRRAG